MAQKHTPGPWHLGQGSGAGYIFGPEGYLRDASGLSAIAKFHGCNGDDKQALANAALMAAAPDLLAACEAAQKAYWDSDPPHGPHPAWVHEGRAAINKATGGTR